MTSDYSYTLYFSPPGQKSFRKIPKHLQKSLIEKIAVLRTNPFQGEKLQGVLGQFRSLHTRMKNSDYRVAYRVNTEASEVVIHYVATRENFYKELSRLRLKPN